MMMMMIDNSHVIYETIILIIRILYIKIDEFVLKINLFMRVCVCYDRFFYEKKRWTINSYTKCMVDNFHIKKFQK